MMEVLWVSNGLFPEATAMLQGQTEIKGTGGWLFSLAEALVDTGGIKLTVVSLSPFVDRITKVNGRRIVYYAIPLKGDSFYKKQYEESFRLIKEEVCPNVVHIHGTEFPHSLAALRACGPSHTVISLQGLASVISRYYLAGLSKKVIISSPTIHDFFRPNLYRQQREMERRGKYEVQLIKEANYVIGRTSWDYAHIWSINPAVRYFHCNEVLRKEFYDDSQWLFKNCVPHSIFLSQGSYPLKGLHKVLEALPIVKNFYPDVSLRVAGHDITHGGEGLSSILKLSTYGRIIKNLIHYHGLDTTVSFLGPLNAAKMKQEYLRANLFICPSSIENSPNSLGEAQIIGTPCLASYAGGIPSFMSGSEEHLFRFEEVEMMAHMICKVFENSAHLDTSSMRLMAQSRHDVDTIVNTVLEIYQEVAYQ